MRHEIIKTAVAASRAVAATVPAALLLTPTVALADITTGDGTTIHGWAPDELVTTDMQVGDTSNLAPTLADKVIRVVKVLLPLLAVASVCVIIYNAVRNMFIPKEDPNAPRKNPNAPRRREMGEVIKDIFLMFFWILFAWIIVELIIYAVTSLELFAQGTLSS